MAIYERGETFAHWTTIRDRDGDKVDPLTVTETISDPCGLEILTNQSMSSSATGVYSYDHSLTSTATYGKYKVSVKATAGSGQVAYQEEEFFVMPWKLENDIRVTTGISDKKSIPDDDLSHIAWKSYKQALRDVFIHRYKEIPNGNPDTGVGFNGTNTSFQTKLYPIADVDGDGSVVGYGEQSCGTDVNCWWINNAGSRQQGYVTVGNEDNGEINIYQNDGSSAIPQNHEGVFIDYWIEYESFDLSLFREAVVMLAAYQITNRMTEVDRVTIADLRTNSPIIEKNSKRFWYEYKRIINLVRKPRVGIA